MGTQPAFKCNASEIRTFTQEERPRRLIRTNRRGWLFTPEGARVARIITIIHENDDGDIMCRVHSPRFRQEEEYSIKVLPKILQDKIYKDQEFIDTFNVKRSKLRKFITYRATGDFDMIFNGNEYHIACQTLSRVHVINLCKAILEDNGYECKKTEKGKSC